MTCAHSGVSALVNNLTSSPFVVEHFDKRNAGSLNHERQDFFNTLLSGFLPENTFFQKGLKSGGLSVYYEGKGELPRNPPKKERDA